MDCEKNYLTDFNKIRWEGGIRASGETVRFWWITLR